MPEIEDVPLLDEISAKNDENLEKVAKESKKEDFALNESLVSHFAQHWHCFTQKFRTLEQP